MTNMIKPVNGHLLIEPTEHDAFIATEKTTYEEIGVVLAYAQELKDVRGFSIDEGDKVYFDAWLAARYPSDDPNKPYWLVKWEDVRAVEYAKSE